MEIRATSFVEMAYLSTIRVLADKLSGPEVASAFVVNDEEDKYFIVTASHAVKDARSVTLHFYSGSNGPDLGPPVPFEIREPQAFWHFHSDDTLDVAVAPLQPVDEFFTAQEQPYFVASIPAEYFMPRWKQLPPSVFDGLGRPKAFDEVLLAGYPNDYRDNPTSLPLLRRGLIATPLWLDHEHRPVFLIDTAASHGTSGGPVFYVEEINQIGSRVYLNTGGIRLLGVFSEVFPPKTGTARAGAEIRPPNVGAAYKTHAVLEVLEEIGFISAHTV